MDSSSELYSSSSSKSKAMGEAINIKSSTGIMSMSSSSNISGSSNSNSRHHRSKEMENLSFEISKYPRDLLQTFLGNSSSSSTRGRGVISSEEGKKGEEEEDDEGLNLGLGLSLGGIFGVDKSKNMGGLIRSSSIAGTMPLFRDRDRDRDRDEDTAVAPRAAAVSNLVRTSSLPVESEEEWRKRKEMQTLRRMEAKRRRSEKQRVSKETGGNGNGNGAEDKGVEGLKLRARLEREQQCLGITNKLIGSSMANFFGSSNSKPPTITNNFEVKGRRTTFGSLQGFLIAQGQVQGQGQGQLQQGSSQGSGESQGGSSSEASELESRIHPGSSSCGEQRSPVSNQSQQDRGCQESMGPSGTKDDSIHRHRGPEPESSSKQPESADNKRKETGSTAIEDMPCVFTIGDGPNGRKVEGILYKYGKGEGVRIMCVCHGNFFSPSEFVKHAGGKDVEHPLRHIVVSPSASPF